MAAMRVWRWPGARVPSAMVPVPVLRWRRWRRVWLCGTPSILRGRRWALTSLVGVPLSPRPVEIACDESGSEGEHLVGGNTDVFAHASVNLSIDTSAACVQEIRARIGSPALEYKANHLLRE